MELLFFLFFFSSFCRMVQINSTGYVGDRHKSRFQIFSRMLLYCTILLIFETKNNYILHKNKKAAFVYTIILAMINFHGSST